MLFKRRLLCLTIASFLCLVSCKYSFKGISIDDDADTYSVDIFKVNAAQAPALLGQIFQEQLIDKIRQETRLNIVDRDADYEIEGTINTYAVEPVAPTANTTALNRLNMSIGIDFTDNLDEEKSWKQNFSYFFDFDNETNLLDIQDTAIESINEQLLEDIFRKAFTNW